MDCAERRTMAGEMRGVRVVMMSLAVALLGGGGACGDRPLTGDAGAPPEPAAVYDPCAPGTRAGWAGVGIRSPFATSNVPDVAGYTSVSVGVRDGVDGFDRSITVAVEGACRLVEFPACAPACAGQTTCVPGNRC